MHIIIGAQNARQGIDYTIIRYLGNVEGLFYIIIGMCNITLGIINIILSAFAKSLGFFYKIVCAFNVITRQKKKSYSVDSIRYKVP